jgi:hypothetical protein
MAPGSIEVWGGEEKNNLKLIGKLSPAQPDTIKPIYLKGYEVKCKPSSGIHVIKLVVTPLSKLPKWHPGKGEKAWIFADEVFLN